MGPAAHRTGPVPKRRPRRQTGRLDRCGELGQLRHCLGQQPRVRRVRHVRLHHRGVGPHPIEADQPVLMRLRQQRFVQPVDRPRAATLGDLPQRRRVRHPCPQRHPAEPSPRQAVGHLGTQRFEAEPVPVLEDHHPQVGLHRDRRPTVRRVEERPERLEEPRVVQQPVDLAQVARQAHQALRDHRLPQGRRFAYRSQHDDASRARFAAVLEASSHHSDPIASTPTSRTPSSQPIFDTTISGRSSQLRAVRLAPFAAGRVYPTTGGRKITRWRTWNGCSAGTHPGTRTRPSSQACDARTFSTPGVSASTWMPIQVMPASSGFGRPAASSPPVQTEHDPGTDPVSDRPWASNRSVNPASLPIGHIPASRSVIYLTDKTRSM